MACTAACVSVTRMVSTATEATENRETLGRRGWATPSKPDAASCAWGKNATCRSPPECRLTLGGRRSLRPCASRPWPSISERLASACHVVGACPWCGRRLASAASLVLAGSTLLKRRSQCTARRQRTDCAQLSTIASGASPPALPLGAVPRTAAISCLPRLERSTPACAGSCTSLADSIDTRAASPCASDGSSRALSEPAAGRAAPCGPNTTTSRSTFSVSRASSALPRNDVTPAKSRWPIEAVRQARVRSDSEAAARGREAAEGYRCLASKGGGSSSISSTPSAEGTRERGVLAGESIPDVDERGRTVLDARRGLRRRGPSAPPSTPASKGVWLGSSSPTESLRRRSARAAAAELSPCMPGEPLATEAPDVDDAVSSSRD
mmetsp:Transcript_3495/g.14443  ORF Transcript_3495/g.14443 Transcript_3495/m.14443 type:complete len:381 (+) Transcript_3495:6521-7663(+)